MRTRISAVDNLAPRLVGFFLASLFIVASVGSAQTGPPSSPSATKIAQAKVSRDGQQTNVRVEGDGRLAYQATRLNNPERLVLDFVGVRLAVSKTSIPSDVEPVRGVRMSQFKPDVARVVIDLERAAPYNVKAEGQSVTVAFAESAPPPVASETPAGSHTKPAASIESPVHPPAIDLLGGTQPESLTPALTKVANSPTSATPASTQNGAASTAPAQTANSSGPVLANVSFKAQNPVQDPKSERAEVPAQGARSDPSAPEPTTPAASTLPAIAADDYLIKPEDVLEVYVYDVPELSREYIVNSAGNVTVPLLPKPVPAAGLSPDQFAHALEQSFRQAGALSRPQITVTVKQSRRSVVTVEGAVKSPQVVPVIGRTQLLSVLSQCGGLADDHGSTATISRGALAMHDITMEGGPATPTATVQLKKLMDGNDPMSQFAVWPGDRVSVERAGIFYVMGEVGHPGGYNLRSAEEQVTVLQALALAGDVTFVAKKSKAFIIRKNSTAPNGRNEIALDIGRIVTGRSPDPALQSNDILYVPGSGGKRTIRTLASVPAAVVTAATYSRF